MKTIYINGNVLTLNDSNDVAQGIVVDDQKIVYVGSTEKVMEFKSKNDKVVDLQGQTMTPGFIDPHSHFGMQSLLSTYQSIAPAPLGVVDSIEKMISVMSDDLKSRQKDKDIPMYVAVGYDHEQLAENRHPIKDDLDKVAIDIPVVAIHASLHVGTFNSKALEVFGISDEQEDPKGGHFGRYPGTNKVNGYAEELAFQGYLMKFFKPNIEGLSNALSEGQKMYAKAGFTSVQDGFTQNQEFEIFNFGAANELLDLDVYCYPPAMESMQTGNHWIDGQFKVKYGDSFGPKENIHYAGFKIVLDGSPQARTAWMSKPYLQRSENDDENYCGYPFFANDEDVVNGLKFAMSKNAPVLVHCNGDASADQLLRCYARAIEEVENEYTARAVMIHCQTVREDQIDLMAKYKIIPAMFPIHTYFWGDTHIKNFGRERANKISNQKYALKKGLLPTSHEDCPVLPPNPLFSIWSASNRVTRSGVVLGEELRLTRYEAIRSVTYNAAYQYNIEESHGTIEVGKYADLLILDTDILTCDDNQLRNTNVIETIKKGKTIYKI